MRKRREKKREKRHRQYKERGDEKRKREKGIHFVSHRRKVTYL